MTTYLLKHSYEQFIREETTQQILIIMKHAQETTLTRTTIVQRGKNIYRERFPSDPLTILRYLKTMAKYNIIVEKKQKKGQPSLWILKKISGGLDFHVILSDHISMLTKLTKSPGLEWDSNLGVTIYGLSKSLLKKDSREEKEYQEIKDQFQRLATRLWNLEASFYAKYSGKILDAIVTSQYIPLDKYLSIIYEYTRMHDIQKWSKWFKGTKSSLTIAPDIELLKLFRKYFYSSSTHEELWNMLNGHVVDRNMYAELKKLDLLHALAVLRLEKLTVICRPDIDISELIRYQPFSPAALRKEMMDHYEKHKKKYKLLFVETVKDELTHLYSQDTVTLALRDHGNLDAFIRQYLRRDAGKKRRVIVTT